MNVTRTDICLEMRKCAARERRFSMLRSDVAQTTDGLYAVDALVCAQFVVLLDVNREQKGEN